MEGLCLKDSSWTMIMLGNIIRQIRITEEVMWMVTISRACSSQVINTILSEIGMELISLTSGHSVESTITLWMIVRICMEVHHQSNTHNHLSTISLIPKATTTHRPIPLRAMTSTRARGQGAQVAIKAHQSILSRDRQDRE